ncbi:MAG TPA: response regulator, partial [Flavisolibacter sp.]|nr:response regulator [Flavisolibacter sp.]
MSLKTASILVIDDDIDVLTAVRLLLRPEVKEIVTEKNPENIRSILAKQEFDVILLDMNFNSSINTGNEGIFWLKKIKEEFRSAAAVIMITAYGDIDLAIRSLKEGAFDFVVKPWHNERLITTIKEAVKRKETKGTGAAVLPSSSLFETELLGKSECMQDIFYKIQKIAPTDANILILGENGTGKELIAKAIHHFSGRSTQPFVKVDVGALTD